MLLLHMAGETARMWRIRADCQGPPAPTKHDPSTGFEKSIITYNALTIFALASRAVIQLGGGSE